MQLIDMTHRQVNLILRKNIACLDSLKQEPIFGIWPKMPVFKRHSGHHAFKWLL